MFPNKICETHGRHTLNFKGKFPPKKDIRLAYIMTGAERAPKQDYLLLYCGHTRTGKHNSFGRGLTFKFLLLNN